MSPDTLGFPQLCKLMVIPELACPQAPKDRVFTSWQGDMGDQVSGRFHTAKGWVCPFFLFFFGGGKNNMFLENCPDWDGNLLGIPNFPQYIGICGVSPIFRQTCPTRFERSAARKGTVCQQGCRSLAEDFTKIRMAISRAVSWGFHRTRDQCPSRGICPIWLSRAWYHKWKMACKDIFIHHSMVPSYCGHLSDPSPQTARWLVFFWKHIT